MSTFTITFGDQAETHVGMQKTGTMAQSGFTKSDLEKAKRSFEQLGIECELIKLNKFLDNDDADNAYVLIGRNGLKKIMSPFKISDLVSEHQNLSYDTKAKMYGRIVNKNARHNLCFSDIGHESNLEEGKGTVVAFGSVIFTNLLREILPFYVGLKAMKLQAESNYYYDVNKCGIGFHGDSERKIVIGFRLGADLPLHFQWFFKGEPVGERIKFNLSEGDVYLMSEKATGNDWKTKNKYTLRHAAGCEKYLKI